MAKLTTELVSRLLILCCLLVVVLRVDPALAQDVQGADCGTQNLLAGKRPHRTQGIQGDTALVTDGAIAAEGARWDAPLAVTLDSGQGSLTYDLGQVRRIEALYFQGDANDTYTVLASPDGRPETYRVVVEFETATERGHGLRARTAKFSPVEARFLTIADAKGDGAYSISEFAAYCRAPSPFPPAMRVAGGAPAAATGPTAPELDRQRDDPAARAIFLFAALALAFVGLGKRSQAKKASRETSKRSEREPPDERPRKRVTRRTEGEPARPTTRAIDAPEITTHRALCLLFVASGSAALIYEVVWLHLLRLVIGASALSVGIVLASFMGGMFLGSLLFPRFVSKHENPLRVYALLEIGIGAFGLLMPIVLPVVRYAYVELFGYGPLAIALRAVIAIVLLLPPTALMGATLPAVARRYSHGRRGLSGLASLYAANTIGAVLGSSLAAFYLLAVWDVWIATITAAALNFVVGAAAWVLSKRASSEGADPLPARDVRPATPDATLKTVYLAVGLSGFTALGAQVVWTRLLTLLFGATVYAFAIILAVFLASLGIGSSIAAYLIRRGKNPLRAFAWTQLALVPALLWASYLLARVLPFASPPAQTPIGTLHTLHVLRALEVTLPAALLWGMSFPFALAAAARGSADTGRASGYVYAANTVGAIAGSLLVSFWIIPTFGTQWAGRTLILVAAAGAAVLFHRLGRTQSSVAARDRTAAHRVTAEPRRAMPWTATAPWALAAGALAAAFLPATSTAFLAHGRYIWWVDPRDQYPYVSEGAASTVAVHIAPSGYTNFHVSGRVEATNNPNDLRLERLLGHLSALAHPEPRSVLVVGLGAGVTAGSFLLHPEIQRIVICEIEPRVVGAAHQFAAENYGVLTNPRVQVVFDDARHFLATTRERFDVITSDPIHPWVRGNSVLFSREYYQIVKDRLQPGGIATQWVPLYETSEQAIQIQMRTFTDAFPNGTVWNSSVTGGGYDVVLLGRREPFLLDLNQLQSRMERSPAILDSLREVKIGSAVDLVSTYATRGQDMQRWLASTPVNRDFSLKLEYISGLALNRDEADPIYRHMVADRSYPDELFVAPAPVKAQLQRRLRATATR